MSNPLLLIASPVLGVSSLERKSFGGRVEPFAQETQGNSASISVADESDLPPGIASMDHWLDLNG